MYILNVLKIEDVVFFCHFCLHTTFAQIFCTDDLISVPGSSIEWLGFVVFFSSLLFSRKKKISATELFLLLSTQHLFVFFPPFLGRAAFHYLNLFVNCWSAYMSSLYPAYLPTTECLRVCFFSLVYPLYSFTVNHFLVYISILNSILSFLPILVEALQIDAYSFNITLLGAEIYLDSRTESQHAQLVKTVTEQFTIIVFLLLVYISMYNWQIQHTLAILIPRSWA